MSHMVTRIRRGAKTHVYLREWRKHLKVGAIAMAERLEIERESYYRLEREPGKLSVAEVIELASAMGIEPTQLFHPPETAARPSIDAMVEDLDDDDRGVVMDLARSMQRRQRAG